ncbi:MAG: FKBP-type peptidyl-prolyl cis-trans isomerase [Solirubrobacterales bacterium]
MDRRTITLIAASALLAVIVAVVLITGGSDESSSSADLTDTSVKPTIEAPGDPAPTELVTNDIVEGSGPAAKNGDEVSVQYVGALYDTGQEFDASWDRGTPFDLTLGGGTVIQGWDQGLVGMKAGGRRELIIPPDLGYGPQGQPPSIPANATLIFVVDMLSIN